MKTNHFPGVDKKQPQAELETCGPRPLVLPSEGCRSFLYKKQAQFLSDLIWFYYCSSCKGQLIWESTELPVTAEGGFPFPSDLNHKYAFQRQ